MTSGENATTSWWQSTDEGIRLSIRTQPNARRAEVVGLVGDELKVRVTAAPVDDAANNELVELLAHTFATRRSAVRVLRGRRSRSKVVQIVGIKAPPRRVLRLVG